MLAGGDFGFDRVGGHRPAHVSTWYPPPRRPGTRWFPERHLPRGGAGDTNVKAAKARHNTIEPTLQQPTIYALGYLLSREHLISANYRRCLPPGTDGHAHAVARSCGGAWACAEVRRPGGHMPLSTVSAAAQRLHASTGWVRDHATGRRKPLLPAVNMGKRLRFREEQVNSIIDHLGEAV